jgi:L-threonylcarbamoyladenylate synthase
MKRTLVLTVDPQQPDKEKIRNAANLIKQGGLVAFPTETVYGLGADALNTRAVVALYKAKNRPFDNPPIVHVCDLKDVYSLVEEVSNEAEKLMKAFWPGPLTLIFQHSRIVPEVTVAGLNTIAIRMPRHRVALMLIRESDCPISAPSANLAGKPSPTSAEHVLEDLDGRIDAVLDAGPTFFGVESTVLDLTVDPPQVLRPGGTPYEALLDVLEKVELNPAAVADKPMPVEQARSPGVKHKHYAPKADMVVVEGEVQSVMHRVEELIATYREQHREVGVLATDETAGCYVADVVKSMGSRSDLAGIARNLFKLLREFDACSVDIIVAEGVPTKGLGLAIVNRLRKASGYRIIKANQDLIK